MPHLRTKPFRAALFCLSLCLPALAADRPAVIVPERSGERHGRLRDLRACLAILDLGDDQKATIRELVETARPALEADAMEVRAGREKLRADAGAAAADPCVVGQDFLSLRVSVEKLRAGLSSLRDQVAGQLTADQKLKLEGCLQAPGGAAAAEEAGPSGQ